MSGELATATEETLQAYKKFLFRLCIFDGLLLSLHRKMRKIYTAPYEAVNIQVYYG